MGEFEIPSGDKKETSDVTSFELQEELFQQALIAPSYDLENDKLYDQFLKPVTVSVKGLSEAEVSSNQRNALRHSGKFASENYDGWRSSYTAYELSQKMMRDKDDPYGTTEHVSNYKRYNWIDHDYLGVKDKEVGHMISNTEYDADYAKEVIKGTSVDDDGNLVFNDKALYYLSLMNSSYGTITSAIGIKFGDKVNEQWRFTRDNIVPGLKKLGIHRSTNKVFKVVKPALKIIKSGAKKVPFVGFLLTGADALIDGEIKPSHIMDISIGLISMIPVVGWIIGGVYLIADGATYLATGKTIGEHLDEVDWDNVKYIDSFNPDHPVYDVMPTYSPGGLKY